jgi:quercetin dioxygenase-like cupin family protein
VRRRNDLRRATGHVSYVIEGEMEIEFDDRVEKYRAGDGLVIPAGMMDRHRPKAHKSE